MESYLELQRQKILCGRNASYRQTPNVVAVREPTRKSQPPTPNEDSKKIQTLEDELKKLAERLASVEQRAESPSKDFREKDDQPRASYRRRCSSVTSFTAVEPTIPELEETPQENAGRGTNFPFHFETRLNTTLQQQHLTSKRLWAMWQQYKSNVEPLIKIVHVSSVQHLFLSTDEEQQLVTLDVEALKYAICFAAAASLEQSMPDASSCPTARPLSSTYAARLEASLSKSRFLSHPTIHAIQALTIYLTCGQHFLDQSYVWSLTAVLVRLALKLKINRDPETQGLSFLDCEYRRRIWWHICTLDARTAEINKTDPLIYERQCTARMPIAIQDNEFDQIQDVEAKRNSQDHAPDMFHNLLQFEITYYMRTVLYSDGFMEDNGWPVLPADGKLSIIESLEKILEEKYYRGCKCGSSICRLAIISSKITISRLKLCAVLTDQTLQQLTNDEMEVALSSSATILENLRLLRDDPSLSRWLWLCYGYAEWDAATICLSVLHLGRWRSAAVTRAWVAVTAFFIAWKESSYNPELYKRWTKLENLKARVEKLQRNNNSPLPADQSNWNAYNSIASLDSPRRPDLPDFKRNVTSPTSVSGSVSSKSSGSVRSAFEDQNWPLRNDAVHEVIEFDMKAFGLMI